MLILPRKSMLTQKSLSQSGYGVVIVNGPRTPNDVTDYLFEQTQHNPQIIFQNSKKIAESDEDRTPQRWRIYSGKMKRYLKSCKSLETFTPAF